MFYLCRPTLFDEEKGQETRILEGGEWERERWWYKLIQVCRRWRYIILDSVSHLDLCLLCTYGIPVTDMLAYSPPLPLIIDHLDESHDITTRDEEDILHALQHHDRSDAYTESTEKFHRHGRGISHAGISVCRGFGRRRLLLPTTFQAHHLRHLSLNSVLSCRVPINYDCHWPRHTHAWPYPAIYLHLPKSAPPMAFSLAPTGDIRDHLPLPYSLP